MAPPQDCGEALVIELLVPLVLGPNLRTDERIVQSPPRVGGYVNVIAWKQRCQMLVLVSFARRSSQDAPHLRERREVPHTGNRLIQPPPPRERIGFGTKLWPSQPQVPYPTGNFWIQQRVTDKRLQSQCSHQVTAPLKAQLVCLDHLPLRL